MMTTDLSGESTPPFLDRLVARLELHPFWGIPFAISTVLILCLAVPLATAGVVLDHRATLLLGLAVGGVAGLIGVPEGVLTWRALLRPSASPRWLRAVRGVVGDEVMAEALIAVGRLRRLAPDRPVRRADVIEQVRVARNRHRGRAQHFRGVRFGDRARHRRSGTLTVRP